MRATPVPGGRSKTVKASTTALSMDYLRRHGWAVDVVEHWVPQLHRRRDLFGLFDLIAVRGAETLAVQTTTKSHISNRAHKIADAEVTPRLRAAGWLLLIHGWEQPNGPGTRYVLTEVDVS